MRALTIALAAIAFAATILSASALTLDQGKIVRGTYILRGTVKSPGFRAYYGPSVVHVTINGRILGNVVRSADFGSASVRDVVSVSGRVHSLKVRARKDTFVAPTIIRVGGNATFRGEFSGLASKSQKPSRFFRGKIHNSKSNLTLRSN